jgi:hypothetical protein
MSSLATLLFLFATTMQLERVHRLQGSGVAPVADSLDL